MREEQCVRMFVICSGKSQQCHLHWQPTSLCYAISWLISLCHKCIAVAKPVMLEKKWREKGHRVKLKKINEYLSNLPTQNRSESGGSCAFWSVRTWNVLFVEFPGVEFSFPSFLPSPSSSTHPHHHTTHFLQTSLSMARTKVCLFYILILSCLCSSSSLSLLSSLTM